MEQKTSKEYLKLLESYSRHHQELINAQNTIDKQLEIQIRMNRGVDRLIESRDLPTLLEKVPEIVKDVITVEKVLLTMNDNKQVSFFHEGFESEQELIKTVRCVENMSESIKSNKPQVLTKDDMSHCPVLSTYNSMLYRRFETARHGFEYCIVALTSPDWVDLYGEKTEYEIETLEILGEQIHSLVNNVYENRALLIERDKYRDIINQMGLGLMEVDNQEHIVTINDAFCQMTGYDRTELKGMKPSDLLIEDKTAQEDINHVTQSRLKGLATTYSVDVKIKSGEVRTWLISGSPRYNPEGLVIGSIGFHLDITEEKKRTQELYTSNKTLKKANQKLDTFVYRVSHDLRSPLLAVIGLTQIARGNLEESADKTALKLIDMIGDKVRHLDEIIVSILHYSRNSRLAPSPSRWDIKKLLNSILSNAQQAEKEIDVMINLNGIDEVYSDQMRWELIINNLLNNAVKYSDSSKENSWVSFELTQNDDHYRMVIEDNGVGIPEKAQQRVFEMFYRNSSIADGSGLGLYIVDDAVKKLGGKITLASEEHVGTRITISLPLNKLDN